MKIIKKINNNIALAINAKDEEVIVIGKGIGFPKTPYELRDESIIEKIFVTQSNNDYLEMFKDIPLEDIYLTQEIIKYGEEYLRVKNKIHKFIPQSSVFGLLLEYTTNYKTIQSNGFLVYQHSPFTWLVDIKKNIFIPSPSLTKIATLFSKATSSWMNTFSIEERERAIKLVFGIIMDNKIQTSKDLKKHIPQVIISISKLDENDKWNNMLLLY